MNIIINTFFLFLFLIMIFYLNFPDLSNNNYFCNKLIIFLLLFCFQFIYLTLFQIKNKCKIDIQKNTYDSLLVATSSVISYSFLNDIKYSNTNVYFYNLNMNDSRYINISSSVFITLFVMLIKTIRLLINPHSFDCIKYE